MSRRGQRMPGRVQEGSLEPLGALVWAQWWPGREVQCSASLSYGDKREILKRPLRQAAQWLLDPQDRCSTAIIPICPIVHPQ